MVHHNPDLISHPKIAIVHDYLAERGGAERVVIDIAKLFEGSAIYTSLYNPALFPELKNNTVIPSGLNRLSLLRNNHRLAMPFLHHCFDAMKVDAELVICSSSGWSHGIPTSVPKVVYCYNTPRWLYQKSDYARGSRARNVVASVAGPQLRRWDKKAAATADSYIAISTSVADRIKAQYGVESDVIYPPLSFKRLGDAVAISSLDTGFYLSVSRLQSYKRVEEAVEAFRQLPSKQLVIAGDGPMRRHLASNLPNNVTMLGKVSEEQLRWLYINCSAVVSASSEDFGLTPVEAALFGSPSILLRSGGFLDTGIEGVNALFFDEPTPADISAAIVRFESVDWDRNLIMASCDRFSLDRFALELRRVASEALASSDR